MQVPPCWRASSIGQSAGAAPAPQCFVSKAGRCRVPQDVLFLAPRGLGLVMRRVGGKPAGPWRVHRRGEVGSRAVLAALASLASSTVFEMELTTEALGAGKWMRAL